jgi:uncharacterized membrane protein (DUF485 family)
MDTPQTEPAQTEHILAEAETRVVYPPPPGMHWAALLAAQIGLAILTVIFFPKPWWNLISNMAVDAWMIYLCLWLRKLNPASMSLFFCAAYIALQLAFAVPTGPVPTAPAPTNFGITLLAATLALLAVLTWIVTIYVMRADLHYHYNLREPVGLYLNGILTFFFSYLYFQYHLRKIAQLRERYGDRPFYYQGGPPLP